MSSLHHPIWQQTMDWKNKPFTYHYSQPNEHRYSLDSIELCWKLGMALNQRKQKKPLRVLDICAGCGVMGFEIAHWCKEVEGVDFVEIQPEYKEHFEENLIRALRASEKFNFHSMNYSELLLRYDFQSKYELILCNPPYFRLPSGIPGKSPFKNRCHYLIDSEFAELCKAIIWCLAPGGEGYMLLRDLTAQGVDQWGELKAHLGETATPEILGIVRGTMVVGIKKN
jgi:tRNA1(Val) A37 N6-methylase TrmN6